jgi:hypothetical protein
MRQPDKPPNDLRAAYIMWSLRLFASSRPRPPGLLKANDSDGRGGDPVGPLRSALEKHG